MALRSPFKQATYSPNVLEAWDFAANGLFHTILYSVFWLLPQKSSIPTIYVKGFAMDWEKIRKIVDVEDDNDPKVHQVIYIIMRDFVDRQKHWVCDARRIHDKRNIGVISLGEGSISEDLEELKKKDLPIPTYLMELPSVLTGPDTFEFLQWWERGEGIQGLVRYGFVLS